MCEKRIQARLLALCMGGGVLPVMAEAAAAVSRVEPMDQIDGRNTEYEKTGQ